MTIQEKRFPNEKKPPSPRRVTVSLTIPQFIISLLAVLAGCVWIFLLGVILGQGFTIPGLEHILPQGKPGQAARVIADDATSTPSGPSSGPVSLSASRVIPSENLAYRDTLKQRTPSRVSAQPPKLQVAKSPPTKTAPAKTEAQGKSVRQEKQTSRQDAQVFNYAYQVAAYKEAKQSDGLVAQLSRSGIKARTEKEVSGGVTWYKTTVFFKGSPEETKKLRAQLKAHKIERLLLRSKSPVR